MKQLKVTLTLTLADDIINNPNCYPKDYVIKAIKNHLTSAIGNQQINDWGYIQECEIDDISEVKNE